jgi:NADH-quinone oxidoreductase subunit M
MVQPSLKRLVAYSSISHMGFVTLGIFSFTLIGFQGAIYVMLAHGITSSALFLLCGMLYERRHTYDIVEFGGLATPMPRYASLFMFTALAAIGLPLLCGFVGEFFVLAGTLQAHTQWAIWAALGVIFSACYLLWAYQRVFFGKVTNPANLQVPDLVPREKWVLVGMCALMLWLGVHTKFFTRRYEASCEDILQQASLQATRQQPNNTTQATAPAISHVLNTLKTAFGR